MHGLLNLSQELWVMADKTPTNLILSQTSFVEDGVIDLYASKLVVMWMPMDPIMSVLYLGVLLS